MAKTDKRSSAEEIFSILRDRICLLDYPPGTVLREADLATEFSVSRTPVRAVLQKLAHAGLIESRDGVGTIVTELSFSEIRDIYRMRLKIAELIGQMDPLPFSAVHREEIEALRGRAVELKARFRIEMYWQINHDLHFLISGIIGNSALRQMWDHFYFQAARIWYQHARFDPTGVAASLVDELDEVHRAICEDDPVALGYAQRNYIAYGLSRLQPRR